MTGEWRDADVLREMYLEQEMKVSEIADELGCSLSTVSEWMSRYSIETRHPTHYAEHPWHDAEMLEEMYVEESMSTVEIARELDTGTTTILRWLGRHGIETRSAPNERPPNFRTDYDGYEQWRHNVGGSDVKHVYVHRLLAVAEYGFSAVADHVIHHKNGCTFDNRHENIEPMLPGDHSRLHNLKENNTDSEPADIRQEGV